MTDGEFAEQLRTLGTRLRDARRSAGLTQAQAAQATFRDRAAISAYENGRRVIGLRALCDLAQAYGTDPGSLLATQPSALDAPSAHGGASAVPSAPTVAWESIGEAESSSAGPTNPVPINLTLPVTPSSAGIALTLVIAPRPSSGHFIGKRTLSGQQ